MRQRRFLRVLLSANALAFALAASAAHAQSQPVDPAASPAQTSDSHDTPENPAQATTGGSDDSSTAQKDSGLQEVIVTANRQRQNLQKVSAAVQVVDGDKLRTQALVNVAQVFETTPSVQVTNQPNGFSIDIRGQGADLPSGSSQGAVALEFDGIYNFLSLSGTLGFFDVNRVEVLPGPQSTRYGPNADGGIVNVITADPAIGSRAGRGSLTVGNYGLVRGEIAQNIPLGDTLALRLAGAFITRNSYYTPASANARAESLRAKLLWQPDDALTAKLTYQFDHVGGTGQGVEPRSVAKVAPYSGDSINNYDNPWAHGDYATSGPGPDANRSNLRQQTFTGNVDYRFTSWAAIDLLGSYINVKGQEKICYAPGAPWALGGARTCYIAHQYAPYNQYTGEVRIHNAGSGKLIWNIGYYHFEYYKATYAEGQRVAGPIGGNASGLTTNAVYGDLTYPVTDRLRAIGGVRESYDKRLLFPGNGLPAVYTRKLNHFDYRAGEEFDITPESMEYFTVATGYRPGGITYSGAINNVLPFANEVNTAFELGLKNRFFDNKLQFNIDAFYYNQKGYQVVDAYAGYVVQINGAPYTCTNGGNQPPQCSTPSFNVNAHTFGVETQIRFSPTRNDVFGVSATYLDAKFNKKQGTCATAGAPVGLICPYGYDDQGTNALMFFETAGSVQPHSPKIALNLNYFHTFRFGSGASLSVGGDGYHSSSYWVHPVHDAALYGFQPGYWQGNLSATLTPGSERWSLNAYVRNVSNYAVKQSTLPLTMISDPRTIGGTVTLKW